MNQDEFDFDQGPRPNADSRIWASNGTVEDSVGSGGGPVDFTGYAPFVNVRLHPSNIPVRCRVGAHVAGQGEGEWHPFIAGDEVLVVLPSGDERSGAVIICRLNNGIDTWPSVVGNKDITGNAHAMRRTIPSYLWEVQNGWMLSSSTTTAQFALDTLGNWLLSNGEHDFISLSTSGINLALGNGGASVFLDPQTNRITLTAGSGQQTFFQVDGSTSTFLSQGTLAMGTSGMLPVQHAFTLENLVSVLINFTIFLANASPTLMTDFTKPGGIFDVVTNIFPINFDTAIGSWLSKAALGGVPPTPALAGGQLTLFIQTLAALTGVYTTPILDSQSLTGIPGVFAPGLCRPGFTL